MDEVNERNQELLVKTEPELISGIQPVSIFTGERPIGNIGVNVLERIVMRKAEPAHAHDSVCKDTHKSVPSSQRPKRNVLPPIRYRALYCVANSSTADGFVPDSTLARGIKGNCDKNSYTFL